MDGKPVKTGVQLKARGFPKGQARVHELRLSAAQTLKDLSEQYCFYTPAMMYMFVRLMGREPLYDFMEETGKEVIPVSLKFTKPIFEGLNCGPDKTWNFVLFGLERGDFAAFRDWAGTLVFMDRDKGLVLRIRYQELSIVDPLFLEKNVVLPLDPPTVPVTAFAIDGNKGCCWLESGDNILTLPKLRTSGEAFEDTQAFANALLGEHEDPYRAAAEGVSGSVEDALEKSLYERYKEAKAKLENNHDES